MNLINKIINNKRYADIDNPFYFSYRQNRGASFSSMMNPDPRMFLVDDRKGKVELSANPDNININIEEIGQLEKLIVSFKDYIYTLNGIKNIRYTTSKMTGCYEFEIDCNNITLRGINENE